MWNLLEALVRNCIAPDLTMSRVDVDILEAYFQEWRNTVFCLHETERNAKEVDGVMG